MNTHSLVQILRYRNKGKYNETVNVAKKSC